MKISSGAEQMIETVVKRPWEATVAQVLRVMAGAEIEKIEFECRIGDGKFKMELALTELGEG